MKGRETVHSLTIMNIKPLRTTLCFFLLVLLNTFAISCRISYSFTDASVSPDIKTFMLNEFVTRAPNINPTYPEYVVEELRKRLIRQTSLSATPSNPDLEYEGAITGYDIKPMSLREAEQEAMNRLTVTVQVKFTNNKNHIQDFEESFSAFADFSSEVNLSDVEETLLKDITEQIIDQVFNRSLANW